MRKDVSLIQILWNLYLTPLMVIIELEQLLLVMGPLKKILHSLFELQTYNDNNTKRNLVPAKNTL